jgi:hypothetical protein
MHKAQIVDLLLSIAHVPVEKVHTIRLVADSRKPRNCGCAASTATTGCTSTRKPASRACPTACCGGPATTT